MTATLERPSVPVVKKRTVTPARVALHTFLILTCLMTLAPLLWAVYASLRTYDDTSVNGYFSIAKSLTLENFAKAWEIGDLPHFYWNTFLITIPALIITLLLSSMVAFGVSRFSFKFNLLLLMIFTAGNLLPQQVVVTPLWRLYRLIEVPEWISASGSLIDSQLGVILIHIAFQSGFCTFVLSNYMKTIPASLGDAAPLVYSFAASYPSHPYPRLANADDPADLVVDVSSTLDRKVAAARCHATQNALFVRRRSAEEGRQLTVEEVMLSEEGFHRHWPAALIGEDPFTAWLAGATR